MKGIIKSMPEGKSFAFIRTNNGAEYFFHRDDFSGHWDDLVSDYKTTSDRIMVTFEVVESTKGPRASNVKRLDWPNQSGSEWMV